MRNKKEMKMKKIDNKKRKKIIFVFGIILILLIVLFIVFLILKEKVLLSPATAMPGFPSGDSAKKIIAERSIKSDMLSCEKLTTTGWSTKKCSSKDCKKNKYIKCESEKRGFFKKKTYYREICGSSYEIDCLADAKCNSGDNEIKRTSCEGLPLVKLSCGKSYTKRVSATDYSKQNCGIDKYLSKNTKKSIFRKKIYYLNCQNEYQTECLVNPKCNSGYKEIKREGC